MLTLDFIAFNCSFTRNEACAFFQHNNNIIKIAFTRYNVRAKTRLDEKNERPVCIIKKSDRAKKNSAKTMCIIRRKTRLDRKKMSNPDQTGGRRCRFFLYLSEQYCQSHFFCSGFLRCQCPPSIDESNYEIHPTTVLTTI